MVSDERHRVQRAERPGLVRGKSERGGDEQQKLFGCHRRTTSGPALQQADHEREPGHEAQEERVRAAFALQISGSVSEFGSAGFLC